MATTKRSSRFNIRPDKCTTEEINELQAEEGVVIYDVDEKVNKYYNGSEWVITGDSSNVFEHFKYNPETDKLEADRAIETTLNSLFLGEQHKMSSGAENIFFSNTSSSIDFYPMWAGLKDQSLAGNQLAGEGIIAPSGRTYGDYSEIEPNGAVNLSGVSLPYNTATYFAQSISGLGIEFYIAEPIVAEDTIFTYKCTGVYHKQSEGAIIWNDKDLDIDWGIERPNISEKDAIAPAFSQLQSEF